MFIGVNNECTFPVSEEYCTVHLQFFMCSAKNYNPKCEKYRVLDKNAEKFSHKWGSTLGHFAVFKCSQNLYNIVSEYFLHTFRTDRAFCPCTFMI